MHMLYDIVNSHLNTPECKHSFHEILELVNNYHNKLGGDDKCVRDEFSTSKCLRLQDIYVQTGSGEMR